MRRLVVLVGLSATIVSACSERSSDSLTGPAAGPQFAAARAQDVHAAITAQERHTAALLKIPGVVGTAVGLLPNGHAAVRIFLVTPDVRGVPTDLDGVPVAKHVTGLFVARSDPKTRQRPAPLGFSVGHPAITAGSIGGRVVDGSGNVYVLSNNHVLANSNDASIGDPELQPGAFDGGKDPDDRIATLSDFQVIDFSGGNNTIDAAIAVSTTADVGNASPTDDGYGTPSATIFGDANGDGGFDDRNALLNLFVQKYGRTTKLTHGQITGINATVSVCYEVFFFFCVKSATFVDQLIISPGGFSGGGDSGSLIVTEDGKNPVGLLFAGSSTETIANRIDFVLNRFGVHVDGSAPPPPPPTFPTDVAITDVSAPGFVTQGATVDVVVTIKNVGTDDVTATFDVTLQDATDNVTIGTQSVEGLAAGASTTRSFSWNTAGASPNAHTLIASHNFSDDNTANDQASTSVIVNEPVTDIAITSVSAPGSVIQGGSVDVVVTVKNVGTENVTASFDVTLQDATDNNATIGTQSVAGLAAGTSTTVTFSWNTTGSSPGSHTLTASHNFADANAANDQASTDVMVNAVSTTIHVGDLDAVPSNDGSSWSATVEVTVHDGNHVPIDGATVRGTWSTGSFASDECTTGDLGGNGTCIFLNASLRKSVKSLTFTVRSVTMAGQTYVPTANHDVDGSSNGTTIRVNKP